MLLDITIETRKGRGFIQPQWTWITYDNGETWEQVYDMQGNPILWCNENIQDIKNLCHQQTSGYWGISGCDQKEMGNAEIDNY